MLRLGKHFLSLSPIFEVFSTQIYSQAVLNNMSFGGARYIATGRGFATSRIPFNILYSRFAPPSIYMGMRNLLLLLYATMAIWIPHLIYFWFSVLSLCIAPFMFNPHQFSTMEIPSYNNNRSTILVSGVDRRLLHHRRRLFLFL